MRDETWSTMKRRKREKTNGDERKDELSSKRYLLKLRKSSNVNKLLSEKRERESLHHDERTERGC